MKDLFLQESCHTSESGDFKKTPKREDFSACVRPTCGLVESGGSRAKLVTLDLRHLQRYGAGFHVRRP